jgi:hypothetical protein
MAALENTEFYAVPLDYILRNAGAYGRSEIPAEYRTHCTFQSTATVVLVGVRRSADGKSSSGFAAPQSEKQKRAIAAALAAVDEKSMTVATGSHRWPLSPPPPPLAAAPEGADAELMEYILRHAAAAAPESADVFAVPLEYILRNAAAYGRGKIPEKFRARRKFRSTATVVRVAVQRTADGKSTDNFAAPHSEKQGRVIAAALATVRDMDLEVAAESRRGRLSPPPPLTTAAARKLQAAVLSARIAGLEAAKEKVDEDQEQYDYERRMGVAVYAQHKLAPDRPLQPWTAAGRHNAAETAATAVSARNLVKVLQGPRGLPCYIGAGLVWQRCFAASVAKAESEGIDSVLTVYGHGLQHDEQIARARRLLRAESAPRPAAISVVVVAAAGPVHRKLLEFLHGRGVPIPRMAIEIACERACVGVGDAAALDYARWMLSAYTPSSSDDESRPLAKWAQELFCAQDGPNRFAVQMAVLEHFTTVVPIDWTAAAVAMAKLGHRDIATKILPRIGLTPDAPSAQIASTISRMAGLSAPKDLDAALACGLVPFSIGAGDALRVGLAENLPYLVLRAAASATKDAPLVVMYTDVVRATTMGCWKILRVIADSDAIAVEFSAADRAAKPDGVSDWLNRHAVLMAFARASVVQTLCADGSLQRGDALGYVLGENTGLVSVVLQCVVNLADGRSRRCGEVGDAWPWVLNAVAKLPNPPAELAAAFRATVQRYFAPRQFDEPSPIVAHDLSHLTDGFCTDPARARILAEVFPLADAALVSGIPKRFAWVLANTASRPTPDGVDFAVAFHRSAELRQMLTRAGCAPTSRAADIAAGVGNMEGMRCALETAGAEGLSWGFSGAVARGDIGVLKLLKLCRLHTSLPAHTCDTATRVAASAGEMSMLHQMWWWGWPMSEGARAILRTYPVPPKWLTRWLADDIPGPDERRAKLAKAARKKSKPRAD